MAQTKIEWCDKSWNPVTGCSPVSEGCLNCYAKRMAYRLKGRYGYPKDDPFKVTFHPDRLNEPLHWKKPSRIFVVSMGDIFHDDVDGFWLSAIWSIIERCYWHTFLILTKRPQRWEPLIPQLPLYKNLWFGISCEDQKTADERIPILLQIPAAKRFVSVEPMLGPVDFGNLWLGEERKVDCGGCSSTPVRGQPYCPGHEAGGIDWVICGGETGPHARPVHPDWVRSLKGQCQVSGVPFFFKSWGEWLPVGEKPVSEFKPIGKDDAIERFHLWEDSNRNVSMKIGHKAAGRLLDGKIWEEIPK